jgi:Icc-related predicted phosphoesterase
MFKRNKGENRGERATVLFVSDLHGAQLTFRKLLGALEAWSPSVLICGGDVAGKVLWPVVVENGTAHLQWMGEQRAVPVEDLSEYETQAGQLGMYAIHVDRDELAALQDSDEHMEEVIAELIVERWAEWLEALEDRCAKLELPAYVMAGNDDPWALDELTFAPRTWVTGADGLVLPLLERWSLLTCGLANETPWQCPRDVPESTLAERLNEIADGLDSFDMVIANIHVPPHDSGLDLAPQLDLSVDPPRPMTGVSASVGSESVAQFLRERQPLMSLHGHIHESRGAATIGRTRAYNPGSEYSEGILRGVLVTIEGDRVVGHQFVSG